MKYLLLLFPVLAFGRDIPDSAIRTSDVQEICNTRTDTVRDVSQAKKKQVYKLAGIPYGDKAFCRYGYEVDHIIPLCMGGSNELSNLQLQSYCKKSELATSYPAGVLFDAHQKDKKERSLCVAVCKGAVDIQTARWQLYNWKN